MFSKSAELSYQLNVKPSVPRPQLVPGRTLVPGFVAWRNQSVTLESEKYSNTHVTNTIQQEIPDEQ